MKGRSFNSGKLYSMRAPAHLRRFFCSAKVHAKSAVDRTAEDVPDRDVYVHQLDGREPPSHRMKPLPIRAALRTPIAGGLFLGIGFKAHSRSTAIREFNSGRLQRPSESCHGRTLGGQDAWNGFETLDRGHRDA
jgi:hypothetical protein